MPDDRLFHKKLGHSEKVNSLTDIEEIVWRTYIQSADDFGVMLFSAITLQETYDRLARRPQRHVQRLLERVRDVGLVQTFEHQQRIYCYQWDWQDYQKVRYPLATVHPRIPAELLAECSLATQYLHTLWPGGGGRGKKLKNWKPDEGWTPPDWAARSGNGSRNGSGNGSRPYAREVQTTRARPSACPIPTPVPIPDRTSTNQLQLLPPALVPTYERTNLPPHKTRRGALPVENADASPERAEADPVPATVCDRDGGHRDGAPDQRQRVEGTRQAPSRAAGVREPADDDALGCPDAGGEGARTAVGAQASRDASAAANPDSTDAAGSALEASSTEVRTHVDRGAREEPDGLKQLRAVALRYAAGGRR